MSDALSVSPDLLRPAVAVPTAGTATGPMDAARRARIARTAQDFEASFTSVMLGQMFQGVETSAPFGGGEGEQTFRSFLTDAMAKSMTRHGGIGIKAVIEKELLKMQGLAAAPVASKVTAAYGAAA